MFFAFLLLKLTYLISYSSFYSDIWLIISGFNPYPFSFVIILPVI